jgi:paraquat-inducible protein B
MSEDGLDAFDQSNELIEETRTKLKAAHAQAAGNADVQAKIEQQLRDLTDVQEELAVDELADLAGSLNELSDLLDRAITEIKHNIDNFLLVDFNKLKEKVTTLLAETRDDGQTVDT